VPGLRVVLLVACLLSSVGLAQEDAGAEQSDLMNEIDRAAAFTVPDAGAPAPTQNPIVRAFQSLNPDIAAIVDVTGGIGGLPPYSLAGDDPDLRGAIDEHPAGFTVQEAEVALQATVDPYLKADLFLTIPNLHGIEVEEAFATSTSLPFDLQLKAGIFRSAFGRQNGQHLHLQDFTRRPLINEAFLGEDGLRAPGVQLSWLVPTPFFLQLTGELFSAAPPDAPEHLGTFGGGKRTDLTYTAELKAFFPATEALSIYVGLDAAFGKSAGVASALGVRRAGATTMLQGVDLYVKYKPPNVVDGYFSLAWTTELFVREVAGIDVLEAGTTSGGFYTQLVAQVARRWLIGVRQDVLGLPTSELEARVFRTSASVTFVASEFARLRLYGEREAKPGAADSFLAGAPNWAGYLQLEVAIGAHGAHPF
jgi:hypothetical protein